MASPHMSPWGHLDNCPRVLLCPAAPLCHPTSLLRCVAQRNVPLCLCTVPVCCPAPWCSVTHSALSHCTVPMCCPSRLSWCTGVSVHCHSAVPVFWCTVTLQCPGALHWCTGPLFLCTVLVYRSLSRCMGSLSHCTGHYPIVQVTIPVHR